MKLRMTAVQPNTDEFINYIMNKYHFEKKDMSDLVTVYDELVKNATPYAIYKINQWITGVKQIDDNQAALVVITLGKGVDVLQNTYTDDGKLQEAYMVECIANELLLRMYDEFNKSYCKLHRRYVAGYIFVGDEIPLSRMRELLVKVQERDLENYEIKSNEYGVITPKKTVVFYAMLSDNPTKACERICDKCTNLDCGYRTRSDNSKLNYGYQRIFGNS